MTKKEKLMKKILVLITAVSLCLGMISIPASSFAVSEPGTSEGTPEDVVLEQLEEELAESSSEEASGDFNTNPDNKDEKQVESDPITEDKAIEKIIVSGANNATNAADEDNVDVIEIGTPEELNNVRNNLSGNYKLVSNIDLTEATASGGAYYNNGKGWRPIGSTYNSCFAGEFDGNGYSIIGLKTSGYDTSYEGLFGCNSGTIKNLTVKGGSVSGNTNDCGGIVGLNRGIIESCYNYNTVSATGTYVIVAGGIAGENRGTIEYSGNFAEISMMAITTGSTVLGNSSTVGGIVGNNSGSINNCENKAEIMSISGAGSSYAGGITGQTTVSIDDCSNSGSVWASSSGSSAAASSNSGGIVGYQKSGADVSNCSNSGNVSAIYRSGNSNAGGITGNDSAGKISNSVNDATILSQSSKSSAFSYAGGIVGTISNEGVSNAVVKCANEGTVSASSIGYAMSGGIAGEANCGIKTCFNIGLVGAHTTSSSGSTLLSGGIIGALTNGSVEGSFNEGTISSVGDDNNSALTGGIAGLNGAIVQQCYNTGGITAINNIGGIVGGNSGTIMDCYHAGTISTTEESYFHGGIAGVNGSAGVIHNVYSVGTLKGTRAYGGSLIGNNQGSATGSVNVCDLGFLYTVSSGEIIGKEFYFSELEDPANYSGFDFTNTWKMGEGDYKLPVLANCVQTDLQNTITIPIDGVYLEVINKSIQYDGTHKLALVYASGLKAHINFELSGGATNAGKAKVTVTGIKPFVGSKTLEFTITKAANTLKVKAKQVKLKAKSLKKKKQIIKVKKAFTVTNAKGKVSYKKISGNKKITVSSTGKITVKKGLKKGKYNIKVRVIAKGDTNYNSKTVNVTVKIIVR